MGRHLILGAGPVGRATAIELTRRGEDVLVASRSGRSAGDGIAVTALDAADAEALSRAAEGMAAVHNCLNPPHYHRWPQEWPPMAAAILTAAERTGAVLVTTSNLYAYGPVTGAMHEGLPDAATHTKGQVRARMWADALAAHQAGRVRAAEVRAADYLGPGVDGGSLLTLLLPTALKGRTVRTFGDPDAPHSWTDVRDVGRLMAAVALDEGSWGRTWQVPTNEPRSQRQALADLCSAAGVAVPTVTTWPAPVVTLLSAVVPVVREMKAVTYQFDRPFVLDSSAAQDHFGMAPTPWDEVIRGTLTT